LGKAASCLGEASPPGGSREPPFSLQPDDQAFREGAPMIPFDSLRNSGAPEYFAELTKDRRLLTSWLLKPNIGLLHRAND
jgi:hypothetical protein